jgi:hypothetical protein
MNDSIGWIVVGLLFIVGLVMAIALLITFYMGMLGYYKKKLSSKENLSMPYDFGVESMIVPRTIAFFGTPFGVWVALLALIAMIDPGLSRSQIFALANIMSFVISVPVIILTWIGAYQGAELSVLEFKMKQENRMNNQTIDFQGECQT